MKKDIIISTGFTGPINMEHTDKKPIKEKRRVKINGVLYSIGDIVEIEEKLTFFIFKWFSKRKYWKIIFIGNDSIIIISDGKSNKTITCEVIIG